jgi:hypothetical protein
MSEYDFEPMDFEVDGETYELGTPSPEQEQASLLAEAEKLAKDEIRQELADEYGPELARILPMLDAGSPDEMRALAHEAAARLGLAVDGDPHPGATPTAVQRLAGDSAMDKAKTAARQGDPSAWLSMRDAFALEQAGRVGSLMNEAEAAKVRHALSFARAAGDVAAAKRLQRQLGGR